MAERVKIAIEAACNELGFDRLKPQQFEAIAQFVEGKDVFVALPTGFGKSVIFGVLPTTFDKLFGRVGKSIAVVVTPLAALMKEFRDKFIPRGISAEFLGELQEDPSAVTRVVEGHHQLVFCSPENLLDNPSLTNMFSSNIYQENMIALIVDEAHCIDKW